MFGATKATSKTEADYIKRTLIGLVIILSLDMICCGYTIGSAVLILLNNGQINAGFAVVPMLMSCFLSSLLCLFTNMRKRKMRP